MDLFLLLAVIGAVFAFRSAAADVRAALGDSTQARLSEAAKNAPDGKLSPARKKSIARRHTLSWWLRELAHGFPVLTSGWQAGWHAHRQAAAELAVQAAKAKADNIEHAAKTRDLIRQHKERAVKAREAIKGTGAPEPTEPPAPSAEPTPSPEPSPAVSNPADSTPPPERTPAPMATAPVEAPEITYDQLQTKYTQAIAKTEARIQQLRVEQFKEMFDQLSGSLRDGKTVGNMAGVVDSIEAEIRQAQHTLEQLVSAKSQLKHDHGGMAEAHQSAPVPGAHPAFYEGS